MSRIVITGKLSVGKTTLFCKLQDYIYTHDFIPELSRSIMNTLGKSVTKMSDIEKIAYRRLWFDLKLDRESRFEKFISDRYLFDILAFSKDLNAEMQTEFKKKFEDYISKFGKYYITFFILPEIEIEDDSMRPLSLKVRQDIHDRLYFYAQKYSHKVVEISGSIDERVNSVKMLLNGVYI